jgi:type VI secretion system protein ImpE
MTAEESVRAGNLADALTDLQGRVRSQPGSAPLRVFLFQLLAVMGQWKRALTQLETAAELDAGALAMRATYRDALKCEELRAEIFAGRGSPTVFGRPEPWMALVLEALQLDAQADREKDAAKHAKAAALRAQGFEAAPATAGRLDDQPFAWIADVDSRLGPMLEAVVNGRYYWVPFARLRKIVMEKPTDLRDMVWTPATLTLANGGETVALIPTRYPGSEAADDSRFALSRTTDWRQPTADTVFGLGQRVLATDVGDHPLLDVRVVELEGTAEIAAEAAPQDPSNDTSEATSEATSTEG